MASIHLKRCILVFLKEKIDFYMMLINISFFSIYTIESEDFITSTGVIDILVYLIN